MRCSYYYNVVGVSPVTLNRTRNLRRKINYLMYLDNWTRGHLRLVEKAKRHPSANLSKYFASMTPQRLAMYLLCISCPWPLSDI